MVQRRVGERRLRFVERIFDRYGAAGTCLTNAAPGIRPLVSIRRPERLPRRRFLLASTAGNSLSVALLLAIAVGLLELVGLGA